MGTTRWGLERSTEQALMRIVKGENEGDEDDHMAGLVEQIAHAMLEEEDDDGRCKPKSVWEAHSTQVSPSFWDQRILDNAGAVPVSGQKRVESQAMELLYMELVRLKMEELAVAQHQLTLYQKALVSARQSLRPSGIALTDGHASMAPSLTFGEQHNNLNILYSVPSQCQMVAGGDWVHSNTMQCSTSKQPQGSPVVYANRQYPIRAVPTSLGAPTSRESGGTGVFLPRCRAGARQLRILESRRKPELHFSDSTRCVKAVMPNKRKEDVGRPSLQYSTFTPMQEVTPEVSLPTEWTY